MLAFNVDFNILSYINEPCYNCKCKEGASVELKTSTVTLYFFRNTLYMKGLVFLCSLFSFYCYNFALLFLAWKGLYWNELIASCDDESSWFYISHGYSLFLMGWEIIDFPFCIAHWQKCQRCQGGSVGSLKISIFKQIHFFLLQRVFAQTSTEILFISYFENEGNQ